MDKTGLVPRTEPYICKIKIESGNSYNSPQYVDVSLTVMDLLPAGIAFNPSKLKFEATVGGPNPAEMKISIQNSGEIALNYKIESDKSWLEISPASGTLEEGKNEHTVRCSITGLNKGIRTATLTISDPDANNSPQTIEVSLTLTDTPPPVIGVIPQELEFAGQVGGANPPSQTLSISNTGDGTLQYQIVWDATWLNVNPASGKSKGIAKNHSVFVNTTGMGAGEYTGSLTISDPEASNDPFSVPVTLTLTKNAPPPPPPPPSTDNEINISVSPTSGGIGSTVTIKIGINGNTSVIKSFGMDINFDDAAFDYVGFSRGGLAGSGSSVLANYVGGGVVKAGGYGLSIPISSVGTLIEIQLRVVAGSGNRIISFSYRTDDIEFMTPAPGSATFNIK